MGSERYRVRRYKDLKVIRLLGMGFEAYRLFGKGLEDWAPFTFRTVQNSEFKNSEYQISGWLKNSEKFFIHKSKILGSVSVDSSSKIVMLSGLGNIKVKDSVHWICGQVGSG